MGKSKHHLMKAHLAACEARHARVSRLTFCSWLPLTALQCYSIWSYIIPHYVCFNSSQHQDLGLLPQLLVFLVYLDSQHLL